METEISAYPKSIVCPRCKFKINRNQHSLCRKLATSLSASAFCGDHVKFLFFFISTNIKWFICIFYEKHNLIFNHI